MNVSDLVVLLYRADWTQLSFSGTVTWSRDSAVNERLTRARMSELRHRLGVPAGFGHLPGRDSHEHDDALWRREYRILVAPAGRYRVEDDGQLLRISDGEYVWQIYEGVAERGPAAGPDRSLRGLVTPQWLLACYDLAVTGEEVTGGRSAIRVTGTPRPIRQGRRGGMYYLLDRVEVLVDAELGILLHSEQIFEGMTREASGLSDLIIDPPRAAEPDQFALPPGMPVADDEPADVQLTGPGWQVAGTAAGVAASAMGFAVRHAPRRRTTWASADDEPDMPGDARLSSQDWELRQPAGDELVNLLHRTGLPAPAVTGELHQWVDPHGLLMRVRAVQAKGPPMFAGILGPDALWDAASERAGESGVHKVARLRARMPDRYRLDFLAGDWRKKYKAIACDGERTTKLFDDRVATGPARPLDADWAAMLDPAWLLSGWLLLAARPVTHDGRPCFRLLAVATEMADGNTDNLFSRAEVIVDAELGILLRQTTYADEYPATRIELRELTADDGNADTAAGADGFRIEPAPGMRAVADSGGPLGDRNLPRPAEAAGTAAALAAGGAIVAAVAVTGWLGKHRPRRDQP
jgi:hypothetical protein